MRIRVSNKIIVALLCAVFLFATARLSKADGLNSPWEMKRETYWTDLDEKPVVARTKTTRRPEKRYVTSPVKIPILWGLKFYQKVLTKIDGDKCGMYPTCSDFSARAVRKHGGFIGIMMTGARLIHEGDELDKVPLIKKYGVFRYYDPLTNNDFWFTKTNDPT